MLHLELQQSRGIVCPSIEHPAGFSADLAARIKQRAGVPVIAVGRFTRLEQAQAVLVREEADLIALAVSIWPTRTFSKMP